MSRTWPDYLVWTYTVNTHTSTDTVHTHTYTLLNSEGESYDGSKVVFWDKKCLSFTWNPFSDSTFYQSDTLVVITTQMDADTWGVFTCQYPFRTTARKWSYIISPLLSCSLMWKCMYKSSHPVNANIFLLNSISLPRSTWISLRIVTNAYDIKIIMLTFIN